MLKIDTWWSSLNQPIYIDIFAKLDHYFPKDRGEHAEKYLKKKHHLDDSSWL